MNRLLVAVYWSCEALPTLILHRLPLSRWWQRPLAAFLLAVFAFASGASAPAPASAADPVSTAYEVIGNKTWQVDGGGFAVSVASRPPGWVASGSWIWSQPATAADNETHRFSRSLFVAGQITSAQLRIAADDYAYVWINDAPLLNPGAPDGRIPGPGQLIILDARPLLRTGKNTVTVEVHNSATGCGTAWCNPAGLLVSLNVATSGPASTTSVVKSIPLTYRAEDPVVNPNTNRVYYSTNGSIPPPAVEVLDGATNEFSAIPLGANASGIAVNRNTNRIYASRFYNGDVAVIDGGANPPSVIKSIPVGWSFGSQPIDAAANSVTGRIFVGNQYSDTVDVIDGNTDNGVRIGGVHTGPGTATREVPGHIAVDESRNLVYVLDANNNSVVIVDPTRIGVPNTPISQIILARIPLGPTYSPKRIAVNPQTQRIYVTYSDHGVIAVVDANTRTVLDPMVPVGTGPSGIAVNSATNRLYVGVSTGVAVVDGATNAVVDTILLPGGSGSSLGVGGHLAVNEQTGTIFASLGQAVWVLRDAFTIGGRVATPSGLPLWGATVSAAGKSVTTNENGNFWLTGLAPGSHTLTASLDNFAFPTIQASTGSSVEFKGTFNPQNWAYAPSMIDLRELRKGDLIFEVGGTTAVRFFHALGGDETWTHVGLYMGEGVITEAVYEPDQAEQVRTKPITLTTYWTRENTIMVSPGIHPPNWVNQESINTATGYSLARALDTLARYSIQAERSDPADGSPKRDFYCSLLVWKAYRQSGVDLEQPINKGLDGVVHDWVTPDELWEFVRPKAPTGDFLPSNHATFTMASPAHLTLTDASGRRTGFDPATGQFIREIPDSSFTRPEDGYESVSAAGLTDGWRLTATGFDSGAYTIKANYVKRNGELGRQVVQGATAPGKVDPYRLGNPDQLGDRPGPILPPNEPPTLVLPTVPAIQYSDQFTLALSASDPNDPLTSLLFSAQGLPAGLTLIDNRNGTAAILGSIQDAVGEYTVTVTVTDPLGFADTKSTKIVVSPENASISYSGDTFAKPNTPVSLRAKVTEPADGAAGDLSKAEAIFEVTSTNGGSAVTFGPVSASASGEISWQLSGGLPQGTYTLVVKSDPADKHYQALPTNPVRLNVDGVAPVVTSLAVGPNPSPVNSKVTIAAEVTDATTGGSSVSSAHYSTDGGSTWVPMAAKDGAFDGSTEAVGADLVFPQPDVSNLCVRAKDAAGNDGSPECLLLATYDPSAGFVTGGGWTNSPPGSYSRDTSLTGKAAFGFVSKYAKGASTPSGNTEFQFHAGGLNFSSTSYEWLVVNQGGTNAQFRGSGVVNGAKAPTGENYKFMLWAGDGASDNKPDTFRVKIWYEVNGTENLVYDNGTEQAIAGGSIVIHK